MRSIGMLAVVTGTLVLASACGDGGGTPPPDNQAPVAGFSQVCTNLSCVFTDASTDPDGNETITARSWNFGDNTPASTETSPTHVFAAAGPYAVVLTVTDDGGETDDLTRVVTVTAAPPANTPPTAGFTSSCTNADCTFTNTSTDVAPGTIISYLWTFGDNTTATTRDATHSYTVTAATNFTVTLTVTDNENATDVETQTVLVTPPPPATTDCATSGFEVNCTLDLTTRSTVRLTLSGIDCELVGNRITIPPPVGKTAFFNVCSRSIGEAYTILDDTGAPLVFAAGSSVTIRFTQGPGAAGVPRGNFAGTFSNWTINIDDGGNPGGPGEPDFTDVILAVQATIVR